MALSDRALRTDHPLLDWARWQSLLAEEGFENALDLSCSNELMGNALMAARTRPPSLSRRTSHRTCLVRNTPGSGCFWLTTAVLASGWAVAHGPGRPVHPGSDRRVLTGAVRRPLRDRAGQPEQLAQLFEQLNLDWATCRSIVHLWSLDAPAVDALTPELLVELQGSIGMNAMNLVQLLSDQGVSSPRLVLVTRQAQAVDCEEKSVSPLPATLWGLGRVINNEAPHLRCRMVDLGGDGQDVDAENLLAELWEETSEDEIAFRGEARLVHRYVRGGLDRAAAAQAVRGRRPGRNRSGWRRRRQGLWRP